MTSFSIRPRFRDSSSLDAQTICEQFKIATGDYDSPCFATILPGHIYLKIKPENQHYWSPQLHLTLEETEEGTLVRGLYGPNPTVWAFFFFGYVLLGLVAFFAGLWGLSLYSLDMPAAILWVVPVCGVLAVLLYLMAQAGQKIGAQQTFELHQFYQETIGNRIAIF